jgi:ribosomal protein S18 acetylase RimI-like enzyme
MAQITALQPEHLADLYRLYRAQTDPLPHCLTPSFARFAADLARPEAGQIIVAASADRALGFAALQTVTDDQEQAADAVTTLFFDDDAAGAALLEACAARARPGPLLAFPQASGHVAVQGYNAGWDGLSDRLASQARLLARHGFVPYYRELLLSCGLAAAPPDMPTLDGIRLEGGASDNGGERERAWINEERIGLCLFATTEAAADDQRAARVGYINWLWTDERTRRRGVARTLMLRALERLRARGCDTCWLSTGADNWPAQALYLRLGFAVVDTTASFIRPGA